MAEPIETLRDRRLSSVEFVLTYIQLRFDGPCLNVFAPFEMRVEGRGYKNSAPGYRDALCDRIGRNVQNAFTVPDRALVIEFDDQATLFVPLNPIDHPSPEVALLIDGSNMRVWNVANAIPPS